MRIRTVLLVALVALLALVSLGCSGVEAALPRSRLQSRVARSSRYGLSATISAPAAVPAAAAPTPASKPATPSQRVFSAIAGAHPIYSALQRGSSFSQRAAAVPTSTARLSTGAIVGIAIAGVVVFLFLIWVFSHHRYVMLSSPAAAPVGGTTIINTGAPMQPATGTTVITQ